MLSFSTCWFLPMSTYLRGPAARTSKQPFRSTASTPETPKLSTATTICSGATAWRTWCWQPSSGSLPSRWGRRVVLVNASLILHKDSYELTWSTAAAAQRTGWKDDDPKLARNVDNLPSTHLTFKKSNGRMCGVKAIQMEHMQVKTGSRPSSSMPTKWEGWDPRGSTVNAKAIVPISRRLRTRHASRKLATGIQMDRDASEDFQSCSGSDVCQRADGFRATNAPSVQRLQTLVNHSRLYQHSLRATDRSNKHPFLFANVKTNRMSVDRMHLVNKM